MPRATVTIQFSWLDISLLTAAAMTAWAFPNTTSSYQRINWKTSVSTCTAPFHPCLSHANSLSARPLKCGTGTSVHASARTSTFALTTNHAQTSTKKLVSANAFRKTPAALLRHPNSALESVAASVLLKKLLIALALHSPHSIRIPANASANLALKFALWMIETSLLQLARANQKHARWTKIFAHPSSLRPPTSTMRHVRANAVD